MENMLYVANTGSDNISAYRVTAFGKVSVASGIAATSELKPLDAFVTSDGKYLYVRNGSM
jgi:DNA-binding beta-propeller fold protein YncE